MNFTLMEIEIKEKERKMNKECVSKRGGERERGEGIFRSESVNI